MTSPQPDASNRIILYQTPELRAFDPDAEDLPMTDVAIDHPQKWIVDLHQRMGDTFQAIRRYHQHLNAQQQNPASLQEQYDAMRRTYSLVAQMQQQGIEASQEQIEKFHQQMEASSTAFAQNVWGAIARLTSNEAGRTEAVGQLQTIAIRQQEALLFLEKNLKDQHDFNRNVEHWAGQKEDQIKDLLARQYADPSKIDEKTRKQIDNVRAYTEAALREIQDQLAHNRHVTVERFTTHLNAPPTKHSGSTAPAADRLSTPMLQREQARQAARGAKRQYEAARAGPILTNPLPIGGLGGNGGRGPPTGIPGADPDSDPDSESDGDDFGRGPPRGPPPTPSYDGEDRAKFKPWWQKVEAYIETYEESFDSDARRINWVGSLLTVKAQTWHQQRVKQVKGLGLADRWDQYVQALRERFTDPSERFRNTTKMRNLKYKGDISQYLSELLDLNDVVQWSGTTFQQHITEALPDEITRLVYSRQGGLPTTDEDFLSAVQEAGLVYENMMANPGLSKPGKGMSASIPERSKSDRSTNQDNRSASNPSPSSRRDSQPRKDAGENKQASGTKAKNQNFIPEKEEHGRGPYGQEG
ncbi:hypothetical protein PG990_012025 [Apiospora arundinis]